MIKFTLSCGKVALVDNADLDALSLYRWRSVTKTIHSNRAYVYAEAHINGRNVLMHRFLCGLKRGDGKVVDHKDGDGLNNTRANLRVCTAKENNWNKKQRPGPAGYTGVAGQAGKFSTRVSGEYLGFFASKHRAAFAINRRMLEVRGEFAVLNRIDWDALMADLHGEIEAARSTLAALEAELAEASRQHLEDQQTPSVRQPIPAVCQTAVETEPSWRANRPTRYVGAACGVSDRGGA